MVAVSEKIPDWKIGVKNSKMENWYKKIEQVKILIQKISAKNYSQEMKKNWTNE